VRGEATSALAAANWQAREIFGRQQDPDFMPHLSLLYGNFDAATKEQIIASIGPAFNQSFPVAAIHLFSTSGEPKDWFLAQSFELQG
jgi:2'-5' RNA ligase